MKKNETEMRAATKKPSARSAAVRCGRPPRELAGEVEDRILDAARKIFLDRGFEGASIEDIAEAARAGKPTIYARFPNKQALFAAAVTRYTVAKSMQIESFTPGGTTIEERLESIGVSLIQRALAGEGVGLIRLAFAEARRSPELGSCVLRMVRERGTEAMARLLSEAVQSGELEALPAFGPESLVTTARYFLDFILLPMVMRALSGEDLEALRAETGPHVSQRVTFFLAACRHGGIG